MRSRDLRHRGPRAARACAGFAIVEILVALSVLVIAASIFCQMLVSATRVRQVNRENALAADASRVVIERMRNLTFHDVYRSYNEDPSDDPGGNGTGPGHLFDVHGLEAPEGAVQGKTGRVVLPSMAVQVTTTSGGGGKVGGMGGGTTTTKTEWQLREDFEDEALGMPRDLNGNNVVDTANHSSDYMILPVRVEIAWKSGAATRKFEIVTQLGDFRLEVTE